MMYVNAVCAYLRGLCMTYHACILVCFPDVGREEVKSVCDEVETVGGREVGKEILVGKLLCVRSSMCMQIVFSCIMHQSEQQPMQLCKRVHTCISHKGSWQRSHS